MIEQLKEQLAAAIEQARGQAEAAHRKFEAYEAPCEVHRQVMARVAAAEAAIEQYLVQSPAADPERLSQVLDDLIAVRREELAQARVRQAADTAYHQECSLLDQHRQIISALRGQLEMALMQEAAGTEDAAATPAPAEVSAEAPVEASAEAPVETPAAPVEVAAEAPAEAPAEAAAPAVQITPQFPA